MDGDSRGSIAGGEMGPRNSGPRDIANDLNENADCQHGDHHDE